MTWPRRGVRRLIGAGLLLPSFLLSPPMESAAEGLKAPPNRSPSKEQPPKTPTNSSLPPSSGQKANVANATTKKGRKGHPGVTR